MQDVSAKQSYCCQGLKQSRRRSPREDHNYIICISHSLAIEGMDATAEKAKAAPFNHMVCMVWHDTRNMLAGSAYLYYQSGYSLRYVPV